MNAHATVSRSVSGELDVVRTISTVLAAATVLSFALTIGVIVEQRPYVNGPWQIAATTTVFGFPLFIGAVARWATLAQFRLLHGTYAIVFSIVVLTWSLAFVDGPLPPEVAPWPVSMTALGTVPAALAWKPLYSWLYLVANSLIIAPIRILADAGANEALAFQFAFFTITVCAPLTALAILAVSAGRKVDFATTDARNSSVRAAALAARSEEQARLDALVHDEVIATIFAASASGCRGCESTRLQATRTLDHLHQLREDSKLVPNVVQPGYLVGALTSSLTNVTDTADFSVVGARTAPLPTTITNALVEATVEAVRNSVTHAAPPNMPVTLTVAVVLSDVSVTITVRDNGRGFDPAAVPENRLGIAVSILGRFQALPGAHAAVKSSPSHGTTVTLRWRQ